MPNHQERHAGALLRPLLQIAIPAKHLTVVRRCLAAFAPRRDMVGMHLLKFKSLTTDQAFMALSLVGGERIPSIEGRIERRLSSPVNRYP